MTGAQWVTVCTLGPPSQINTTPYWPIPFQTTAAPITLQEDREHVSSPEKGKMALDPFPL